MASGVTMVRIRRYDAGRHRARADIDIDADAPKRAAKSRNQTTVPPTRNGMLFTMNELEHQLDSPFADTLPEAGAVHEVAPGVHWVRMPLPFALDHINLWLLRDEIDGQAGWTIIDCGITDPTIKAHWEQIFDAH